MPIISKDFHHKIPTQIEIESAKLYNDKIFKFYDNKKNIINIEFKNFKNGNNNK